MIGPVDQLFLISPAFEAGSQDAVRNTGDSNNMSGVSACPRLTADTLNLYPNVKTSFLF
jgi:hypothetical protein